MDNTSIEWCLEKLESLKKCNLNPENCTHDKDEHGKAQSFDYASIDMTLEDVIGELKRLKERSKDTISVLWSIDDIKSLDEQREDESREPLSDDECKEVLRLAKDNHDATIGINWDVLEVWIDEVLDCRE